MTHEPGLEPMKVYTEARQRAGKDPLEPLRELNGEADPRAITQALRGLRAELEGADRLTWEATAAEAVRLLKGKGVERAARLVDAALRVEREEASGHEISWPEVSPAKDPVDGATLLDDLVRVLRRFVVLRAGRAEASALWIVHTWAHDTAGISPLLAVLSPDKRCGKTTFLSLLGLLVPRPIHSANITPAATFRLVERDRPTLLIDEGDTFLKDDADMRGLVNSGHRRDTAAVVRTVGEDHEPRVFSTWAPKAIACIGRLAGKHGTLEDRSIRIDMRRKLSTETVERLRPERLDTGDLKSRALRWIEDHDYDLREADPEIPDGLHDRAADNWRSLLAIADLAGGDWPTRAREACAMLEEATLSEGTIGAMLLEDIRAIFDAANADRLPSEELVKALLELHDRPWPEWGYRDKGLNQRSLATLLRPFGVVASTIRSGGSTPRGYKLADFADAFARYLGDHPPELCATCHNADQDYTEGVAHSTEGEEDQKLCATGSEQIGSGLWRVAHSTGGGPTERTCGDPDDPDRWPTCPGCDRKVPHVNAEGLCGDCEGCPPPKARRNRKEGR